MKPTIGSRVRYYHSWTWEEGDSYEEDGEWLYGSVIGEATTKKGAHYLVVEFDDGNVKAIESYDVSATKRCAACKGTGLNCMGSLATLHPAGLRCIECRGSGETDRLEDE